ITQWMARQGVLLRNGAQGAAKCSVSRSARGSIGAANAASPASIFARRAQKTGGQWADGGLDKGLTASQAECISSVGKNYARGPTTSSNALLARWIRMDAEISSKSGYAARAHDRRGKSSLAGWAAEAGVRLTKRASLALTLLVSLV